MLNTLKGAVKSGHGDALLYGVGIGLIASDIIPTIGDAIYFRAMASNKRKLENGEITPREYWTRDAILYYGINPIYWSLVVLLIISSKGSFDDKVKLGLGIVGAGAVVGVIAKNIREENALKK